MPKGVGNPSTINRGKTAIFFSKPTNEAMKLEIQEELGVQEIKQIDKYLGMPSLVGKHKKASFDYIKESIWRIARMGTKIVVSSRKRNLDKDHGASNPNLFNVLL